MAIFDRKRVMRGAASSVAAIGVRVALQLLQVPILYLGWDVRQASAWLVLWTLPSYMSLTVSSFSTAGGTLAIEAKRRGDIEGARAAYRATWRTVVGSNLLMILAAGIGFNFLIDDRQWGIPHGMVVITVLLLGLYVAVRVQGATQDMVYRYGEDYGGYGLLDSAATVAELAAMALVVSCTRQMAVMPLALMAVRLGFYLYLRAQTHKRWPELFGPADSVQVGQMVRRLFVPFLGFIAMPLLFSINIQGYSVLVSNHYGPVLFATFLTMRTLARMVDQICGVVNRMLFFELSYLDYGRDRATVIGTTAMTIALLVGVCAAYIGTLLLVGQPLHALWTGGKIAFSGAVIMAFGAAGLMRAMSDSLFNMLASRNAHVGMAAVYLAGSLVGLGAAEVLALRGAPMVWVAACVNIGEAVCVAAALVAAARLFRTSVPGFVLALLRELPAALGRLPAMVRRRTA